MQFDGSVAMVNEDINIMMTFNSPGTEFKHLLSMVPAVYTKDFETIQTNGKLAFNGNVKGLYNETSLPSFDINLMVENAMFKYPDLPEAVTNVNIQTKIYSKGGDADNTIIDVSRFHLEFGKNPVDMNLLVKNPVSDPDLDCKVKGTFNLADVQTFYPLEEGDELKGMFVTDITLNGKLSAIEEEKYEEFTALGSMLIKGFEYKSSYVKDNIEISNAQLNFSPQYLDLVSLKTTIGRNDFNASGKIENYLAYALNDETLSGQFTTSSTYFNLNDLMTEEDGESQPQPDLSEDTTSMSIIEVPANLNFRMLATFGKLIYDNIEIENVNGKLLIENQVLILENLGMNLLDGEMIMNGSYSTLDPEKPSFDFGLDIKKIDIQKAYNTFTIITEYAPIAKKTTGDISTKVRMKSILGNDMMPLYETMTAEGELSSTQLTIQDVNTLNKIGNTLNMEELKRMVIDKILLQFKFIDGKLLVEPFDMKLNDVTANLGGWTAIDESIEYVMNLKIPRAKFGGAANNTLNSLVSQANAKGANVNLGETVSLDVLIGGTLTDPQIKTGLKDAGKNLMNDMKQQVQAEIEKKKRRYPRKPVNRPKNT
ncbi:MAG: AsmA-like C-terminal region-containing protein [Bacteroidales bacterium]